MTHQRGATLLITAFLAFALPFGALAQQSAKHKVIFQVSDADPAKWNLTLNNARNVQTELGRENVQIESETSARRYYVSPASTGDTPGPH